MQDKCLFEYAVIRLVPRVEREEFLNVGVILYCASQKFLQAKYTLNEHRLQAFSSTIDIEEIKENLKALEQISMGDKNSSPIAWLDITSRFRWLTATRSTILQPSPVHPGLCADAKETLDRLFDEVVL